MGFLGRDLAEVQLVLLPFSQEPGSLIAAATNGLVAEVEDGLSPAGVVSHTSLCIYIYTHTCVEVYISIYLYVYTYIHLSLSI